MDIRFDGKRTLVTGAGRGIGRDLAVKLAECGAHVIGVCRTQADLDSLKQQVPDIQTHAVDLSDWDKAQELVYSLGQIDLLVNNAGAYLVAPFLEATREDLDLMFNINYRAAFSVSQAVAKGMIERGSGGAIVMLSSLSSTIAVNNQPIYTTTKAAMDQLTRCLAIELGPHKIRVNAVNPALVLTKMTLDAGFGDPMKAKPILDWIPLNRLAEVEDVVNTALYLLSDKAAMLNGITVPVDGGMNAVV